MMREPPALTETLVRQEAPPRIKRAPKSLPLAYHYTIGAHLPAIVTAGSLRPTALHTDPGERPILWFSRNPVWEPTAAKARIVGGRLPTMTHEARTARLLVRFACPAHRLVRWPKIGRQAGTWEATMLRLEVGGRSMGADPGNWMGTVKPIRLREVGCEMWDGIWLEVSAQAALELWEAMQARPHATLDRLP